MCSQTWPDLNLFAKNPDLNGTKVFTVINPNRMKVYTFGQRNIKHFIVGCSLGPQGDVMLHNT